MKTFRSAITAAAVTAIAATAASVPAYAGTGATTAGWRVVYSHHYGTAAAYSGYTNVTVVGIHNAWVFGSPDLSAPDPAPGPVALHWNGETWAPVSMPSGVHGPVIATSVLSSTDIWAVTDRVGYVLHWNGARWLLAKTLPGGPATNPLEVTGVLALNDSDVWVFGSSGEGPSIGTWHYDGHTWSPVTSLAATVVDASATSPSNIWGIGASSTGPDEQVDHYNGHAWQDVTPASLASAAQKFQLQFGSAWAQSSTSTWVTAWTYNNGGPGVARLYHVVNGSWGPQRLPWPANTLSIISKDGNGGFWALATSGTTSWIWHRWASGAWTRIAAPSGSLTHIDSYAPVPKTTSLWAAGVLYATARASSAAAVWAYGPLE